MSQTGVVLLQPNSPSHRKSSNIYIFNPLKNVKKKKNHQSALCHAAKYQQSSSVLRCCDLHRSEVLVLFQAPFSASWTSGNKRESGSCVAQRPTTSVFTSTVSPHISHLHLWQWQIRRTGTTNLWTEIRPSKLPWWPKHEHGERIKGHTAHKQRIYKGGWGGLDLKASFNHTIELCCKKEEMVREGSDACVILGGLVGLESGITQMPVSCDMPELKRGDSHQPATPACREKDLPSCIGDIILMVNLAK